MNDRPMIAPMFPENEPTKNSTLDELAAYALLKQDRIIDRDKKNAEDLWLMGQALQWAKEKVQHGEWENWWKVQGFKKTYVWQARKLYESATLDEVQQLGMTEALRKFEIVAQKKSKSGKAPNRKLKDENALPVRRNGANVPERSQGAEDDTEAHESSSKGDCGDQGGANEPGDLADQEEKALKASLRKLTPKDRAVVIRHALEFLRDDLSHHEVDAELQDMLEQIAHLAQEVKVQHLHIEAA